MGTQFSTFFKDFPNYCSINFSIQTAIPHISWNKQIHALNHTFGILHFVCNSQTVHTKGTPHLSLPFGNRMSSPHC